MLCAEAFGMAKCDAIVGGSGRNLVSPNSTQYQTSRFGTYGASVAE